MSTDSTTQKRLTCPSCGTKGKRVGVVTLRALLKDELVEAVGGNSHSCCMSDDEPGAGQSLNGDTGWRFCESRNCDVVYFAEDSDLTFAKEHLKVPVGVKETTGDRPLCYCFGHSVATIKDEIRSKGRSDALEDIRHKMKEPGCRCEVTNPSGACCLGGVSRGIKIAHEELGPGDSEKQPSSPPRLTTGHGEKIAKIGTVASAIMASSCCWLPLVLLAFGVSGAGIAGGLETYRPLFITVTFGFLAAAFYFTYRPRTSQTNEGNCCSTAHDFCAVPNDETKRRFSMITLNKAMLWGVTLLAVLFLFFPKYVGLFLASREAECETTATNPLVRKTTIAIDYMTCEGCAVALESNLKDVPGVLSAKVDYNKKQAVVSTEACCPFPKDEILKTIENAGFVGAVR
jgi:copper chaperone CopZ